MKRSFVSYVLPGIISAALLGCLAFGVHGWIYEDDLREADAQASIGPSITKAIELGQTDPWAAMTTLTREVQASVASLKSCRRYACERTPAVVRFEEARLRLFHEALDRREPASLVEAFQSGELSIPPVIAVMALKPPADGKVAAWVDSLLSRADSASGRDETTHALLRTAGAVLESGRNTLRDTSRATNFYARAWVAGDPKAAGRAARLYYRLGDLDNAYLWSIRCINECKVLAGIDGFTHETLQAKLGREVIAQAEKLAADPDFLEFRRSGVVESSKATPGA